MIDLLAAWGVTSAAGLIFKPVIEDLYQELKTLTKDATEDWVKDFFKGRLSAGSESGYGKLLIRFHREPLDIAAGKAIKGFLEIFQDCLDDAELDNNAIASYTDSIKLLLKEKSIRRVLGSPFQDDDSYLDTRSLKETWECLSLLPLPDDFDWNRLSKKYLRKVNAIYQESDELKEVLKMQLKQQATDSLEELAGIKTDFNLIKYQETVLERYSNLKLESLDSSSYKYDGELKIYQVFIPQNVKECQQYLPQAYELPKDLQRRLEQEGELERKINPEELEHYKQAYTSQEIKSVLEVIEDDKYKYIVILGDPGSGKSTLLQYLAVEWARLPLKELPSHPLTLLIELRSYIQDFSNNRCQNFLEFIHQGSNWICHLNQNELDRRLKQGEVRILFDGLDEVFNPQQRATIIAQIHNFTQTYDKVKVIVTSRIIGYKPQQLKDAEFHLFMLQDLNPKQIDHFLVQWHNLTYDKKTESQDKERKQERITKAIKESFAIQQLAGNPLLLTMMAILNRNQDLPRDRAKLYERSSELLLYQWDVEGKLLEDPELKGVYIDLKDKQAMLRNVAHFRQATEKGLSGNIISQKDLETVLVKYLKAIDVNPARKVARLMIDQLRTRNFILCDVGSNYYAFVHRTFLEYFCAWSYIWEFKETHTLSIEQIKTEVYGKNWQDESWHEVLRLIAGMLEPKFTGEIIEFLMEQDSETANFANLFLAAECLEEVRNRKLIANFADKLLEKLKQFARQFKKFTEQIKDIDLKQELSDKVIDAIAKNWKNNPHTLIWLKNTVFDARLFVSESAFRSVIQGWKDNPDTLVWLQQLVQADEVQYIIIRSLALEELARSLKDDPNTLVWLQQLARSDEHYVFRNTAIQELARGWKDDPDTLVWLQQLARSDEHHVFRSTAIQELARGWKDDPDTLVWLQQLAQADNENEDIRIIAVQELAKGWQEHPRTLPILQQLAQFDRDEYVRSVAVEELAKGWKEHPRTLPILQQLARSDEHEDVRSIAILVLASDWNCNSEIFDLLTDCAVKDPFIRSEDEYERFQINPRQEALERIVEYFLYRPETKNLLIDRANNDRDEKVRGFAQQALEALSE